MRAMEDGATTASRQTKRHLRLLRAAVAGLTLGWIATRAWLILRTPPVPRSW
jgi:hypothetical protein